MTFNMYHSSREVLNSTITCCVTWLTKRVILPTKNVNSEYKLLCAYGDYVDRCTVPKSDIDKLRSQYLWCNQPILPVSNNSKNSVSKLFSFMFSLFCFHCNWINHTFYPPEHQHNTGQTDTKCNYWWVVNDSYEVSTYSRIKGKSQ